MRRRSFLFLGIAFVACQSAEDDTVVPNHEEEVIDALKAADAGNPPAWLTEASETISAMLSAEDRGYLGELDLSLYSAEEFAADPAFIRLFIATAEYLEANDFDAGEPLSQLQDTATTDALVGMGAALAATIATAGVIFLCSGPQAIACAVGFAIGAVAATKVSASEIESAAADAPQNFADPVKAMQWGVCTYTSAGGSCTMPQTTSSTTAGVGGSAMGGAGGA